MKSAVISCALAIATGAVGARPQDARKEYDLTWNLPHDRAAVYEVFDVTTKKKRGGF